MTGDAGSRAAREPGQLGGGLLGRVLDPGEPLDEIAAADLAAPLGPRKSGASSPQAGAAAPARRPRGSARHSGRARYRAQASSRASASAGGEIQTRPASLGGSGDRAPRPDSQRSAAGTSLRAPRPGPRGSRRPRRASGRIGRWSPGPAPSARGVPGAPATARCPRPAPARPRSSRPSVPAGRGSGPRPARARRARPPSRRQPAKSRVKKATRGSPLAETLGPPEPRAAPEDIVEPGRPVAHDPSRQDLRLPEPRRHRAALELLQHRLDERRTLPSSCRVDVLPAQQEIGEDLGRDGQALPPADRHGRAAASRPGSRDRPSGHRPGHPDRPAGPPCLRSAQRSSRSVASPGLDRISGREVGQADQRMRPQEPLDDRRSRLVGGDLDGRRAHCRERRAIERQLLGRDPAPGLGRSGRARWRPHGRLAAARPGMPPSGRRARRRSGRRAGGGVRPSLPRYGADATTAGAGSRRGRSPGGPARRDPRASRRGAGARAGPRRPPTDAGRRSLRMGSSHSNRRRPP